MRDRFVPMEDGQYVEAKARPGNIAAIDPGREAQIKLSACDGTD